MPEATIMGVNFWIVVMILLFLCTTATMVLGPVALEGPFTMVIAFLTIGLTLLISMFGWGILVIPSLFILLAVGFLIKQF